jgi:hypothetical protein
MISLKRPNLQHDRATREDPYLSVRKDRTTCGLSASAVEQLGAQPGDYLHLAFDRARVPLIGVIGERTEQHEPKILEHSGTHDISSTMLCTQLLNLIDGEIPEKTIRYYFEGTTIHDKETGATLHKLEVPKFDRE